MIAQKLYNIKNINKTMKTKLFTIMFLLMLIPFSSAFLGNFDIGSCVPIVTNLNSTAVNISILTSPSPLPSILLSNVVMTKKGNAFNYTFCNTNQTGTYTYGYCDVEGNCYSNDFYIGKQASTAQGIIYLGLLVIIIFGFIFLLNKMISSDTYALKAGYGLGAYFALLISSFVIYELALNFLTDIPFISNVLNYLWLVLALLALPIFLIVIFSILLDYANALTRQRKERFASR